MNETKPTVPIMLKRMSEVFTTLRSLTLLYSSSDIRFAAALSTPNGSKCLEVMSGFPIAWGLGESWVPSLTSTNVDIETNSFEISLNCLA